MLAVFGLDYALKSFAAAAGARDLAWLLAPVAALVSRASGHAFVAESGAGYVSRALYVVIAPACSGLNFMIVAFTALACGFFTKFVTAAHKCAWLLASAALAYPLTLAANSPRILAALVPFPSGAARAERSSGMSVPLASYFAVTVVTPPLRGAGSRTFSEHTIMIAGAAGCVTLVLWLSARLAARNERRLGHLGARPEERRRVACVVDVARRDGQSPLSG